MALKKCARLLLLALLSGVFSGSAFAQVKIFVDSQDGQFATALAAAFNKKKVPAVVVTDKNQAEYVLNAAPVYSKDESGAGKIARCMFLSCAGMNGFSTASVELKRVGDSAIVWAYQVRKGNSGPLAIQSLSEAIAKHLKNEFLEKGKNW